jgi:predicted nuclease of predicted toxin-antitoxin system
VKLLADEGVEQQVVLGLRQAGFDVAWVLEIGHRLTDEELLALAQAEQRVLLTGDVDFGEGVHRLGRLPGGVAIIRCTAVRGAEKVGHVRDTLRLAESVPGWSLCNCE